MKKITVGLLLWLFFYGVSYGAPITVPQFLTPDDVTVTHLEQLRVATVNAINSADGGLLQAGTVPASKLDANANPENRWNEAFNDFVYTGLTIPTSASLSSTTTAGTGFIYGTRVLKDATAHTYTASKHTYVDLSNNGTYTYNEVAIGASEPSVTANSIRLARVSTDATTVLAVRDDRVTAITLGISTTITATGLNPGISIAQTGNGPHLRFTGDPTVASPTDGDLWFTGSALNFRNGTTTVDLLVPNQTVKGWIQFNGTGTIAITDSYNVSGIVDNGTGDTTISWDTDFTNAGYGIAGMCGATGHIVYVYSIAVGSVRVVTLDVGPGTAVDTAIVGVIAIGDQ